MNDQTLSQTPCKWGKKLFLAGEENVLPFIPHLHFFFFFEVEISLRTLFPLFMPGSVNSGSARWDDYGQMFPEKVHVSSFPNRFPHYAWTVA